ncbi:uncharacterized protein [Pocillopora verrucosa]|uniref:uncharacterized protein n=1 Tax=Pocillopora verrucosa TaxID=203993 RepID=UPI0033403D8E
MCREFARGLTLVFIESEAKPCLSKESWYDSSGEMMDNVRLWILSMVSLRYAAHFEIHPAVEQDHQVVISEHESGSDLDINEKKNVRIIDHSDREWSTADHQLYSRNEELLFSKKTKHKSGRVVAINQDDDTVIAKELNRTSKENDQREQQRHHRVLLQKNLRRELRRSSKKHNQAQKKKYF